MRICVITPVLDDWDCLRTLLPEVNEVLGGKGVWSVHVVDDGSIEMAPMSLASPHGAEVEILRLMTNVGHQRAIAVALVDVVERVKPDYIVVMDADGEDAPKHIPELLSICEANSDAVVVAQRRQRVASTSFKWLYSVYKSLFRAATGQRLDFGNFVVMSGKSAERLCAMPELWNHFPATVMKSRLPIERVPLPRRARYAGESRMSLVTLINHGLSGLSVFTDTVFTRMLILVSLLAAGLGAVIVAGLVLRLSTDVPIPGWAALSVLAASIGVMQLITALLVVGFLSLSSRTTYSPAPIDFAVEVIAHRYQLPPIGNGSTNGDD